MAMSTKTLDDGILRSLLETARFAPTVAQVARKAGVKPHAVLLAAERIGARWDSDGRLTLGSGGEGVSPATSARRAPAEMYDGGACPYAECQFDELHVHETLADGRRRSRVTYERPPSS